MLWSAVATRLNPSGEDRPRGLSLWWDSLPGPIRRRAGLEANTDVDVAIVGAGFTGLWTAYYLLRASRGSVWRCSRRSWLASARRVETAGGARRCSRSPTVGWSESTAPGRRERCDKPCSGR